MINLRQKIERVLPADTGFVILTFSFGTNVGAAVCSNCIEKDYIFALRAFLEAYDLANQANGNREPEF